MAFHDLHELVKERSPRQHLAGYRCRPGDMASEMALLRPDRRRNRFAEKRWSDPKHVGQRIDRLIRSRARTGLKLVDELPGRADTPAHFLQRKAMSKARESKLLDRKSTRLNPSH